MPEASDILSGSPIPRIRGAIRFKVHQTSLRAVARSVGLSPSGLSRFVDGANPNPGTIRKLRTWYRRHGTLPLAATADEAIAAVVVLCTDLPDERRAETMMDLLKLLRSAYRDFSPEWLVALEQGVSERL
ncbi:hypothetical protein HKM21_14300 [Longimicrobium terrae]|nr:hypothetical protein [Longimicrobium terrae]